MSQENLYFLGATTGAACQQVEFYHGQDEDFLFTGTGTTFRVYSLSSVQPPYELIFEYRFRSFIRIFNCMTGIYTSRPTMTAFPGGI